MDVALIKYPQNDVDRHESREDEKRFIGERSLENLGRTLEAAADAYRQHHLLGGRFDRFYGVTERGTGRQVERYRHGWKLTLMRHRESRCSRFIMSERTEWDLHSA